MLKHTITILLAAGLTLLAGQTQAQEAITADPDAVSWSANRVDMFSRGTPDGLWHNWWDGNTWGTAENLGGGLIGGPGVSSWSAGRLDVFVRGTTSALFHKAYDNAWYNWEQLSPDNTLASDPVAVAWSQDRIDVFAKGNPNGLWHTWWNRSGGWGNGENLGGGLIGGPGVSSWGANRLDVFVQGDNGALFHKAFDGTWREWVQLGPAGALGSDPTAVSWGPNRIDVFAKGAQNGLWHMAWDGSRWSGPENLGGNLGSGPGVSSKGPGQLQVFAADGNNPGKLMVRTYDQAGWHEWAPVVSVAAAITKQIVPINQNDPVLVELVTVTQYPGKLQHLSLETPPGFAVVSMTPSDSGCPNTPGSDCKQRWLWGISPGQNCTLNGDYKANFNITCANGANCGPQPYSVPFSLQSENFCHEHTTTVDTTAQKQQGLGH